MKQPSRGIPSFKDPHAFKLPRGAWREVARAVFQEVGGMSAVSADIALSCEDWTWFCQTKFDPSRYTSWSAARDAYQAQELLRKFPDLPASPGLISNTIGTPSISVGRPSDARRTEALRKGRSAEHRCRETNTRLRLDWLTGEGNPPPGADKLISSIQRKVKFCLDGGGERDCSFSVREFLRACRWGKGVTDITGPRCSVYNKFDGKPSFTRQASWFAALLMEADPVWRRHVVGETDGVATPLVEHSPGNRVTTVPKTAQTDRLIAIEPHWNIYFQLGVGQMLRRRLRRVGIDLSTQEVNRQGALLGSRTGTTATIDLSNASDTVSLELVRLLLPPGWVKVMEMLRSTSSFWPDTETWEKNHKFSSMGNGFTFELETLIFWAIAKSVAELTGDLSKVPVYGDDILVPSSCFSVTCDWLEYFGFEVNTKKSYGSGLFRESCGMNAFGGIDITPFRLTNFRTLSDAYVAYNALLSRGLVSSAHTVLRLIPRPLRRFGPETLGDSVLHSTDINLWKWKLCGDHDQFWFWGMEIQALTFESYDYKVEVLEPALLYSWYTSSSESACHGLYSLREKGRWRFRGSVTLGRKAQEWIDRG
jgi:hypothetical protein